MDDDTPGVEDFDHSSAQIACGYQISRAQEHRRENHIEISHRHLEVNTVRVGLRGLLEPERLGHFDFMALPKELRLQI